MGIVLVTLGLLWMVLAYFGTLSSAGRGDPKNPDTVALWIAKLLVWGIAAVHFLGAMACKAIGW